MTSEPTTAPALPPSCTALIDLTRGMNEAIRARRVKAIRDQVTDLENARAKALADSYAYSRQSVDMAILQSFASACTAAQQALATAAALTSDMISR